MSIAGDLHDHVRIVLNHTQGSIIIRHAKEPAQTEARGVNCKTYMQPGRRSAAL